MNAASTELDVPTFEFVRQLVREHAAIALEADKGYLVESRLTPLAREQGLSSIRELAELLRGRPFSRLHAKVVEAMTTNETSFFRDVHPFNALQNDVLPALIAARQSARKLTIWSAACSTGQEPYSIAILLAEHFPELANWNVQIFASDLGQQVLKRAASGEYSALECRRGLPPALLHKYFDPQGGHWRVKPALRRRVQFMQINLIERWPALPSLDVVFLRNVLIYFTQQAKRNILENVKRRLAKDGTLFFGGAETPLGIDDSWQRVCHDKTSTYRLA
jgi:chemotaxis protein methyltransferase CheR